MDYLHFTVFYPMFRHYHSKILKNLQQEHEYVSDFLEYLESGFSRRCICASQMADILPNFSIKAPEHSQQTVTNIQRN